MTAPAYKGVGGELYSSAVFAFAPEIALPFHRALAEDDDALVSRLLGVRAPLLDPTPEHVARLSKLLDHGLEVAAA
ncbi:hypothetical protein GCM10023086_32910 [Streptomyces venetus]|uniref:Uncharacterized protein n=1 Tax=Streptomyces venetus TaxID=1701086 RepID=A0ABP8FWF8_9ACTN